MDETLFNQRLNSDAQTHMHAENKFSPHNQISFTSKKEGPSTHMARVEICPPPATATPPWRPVDNRPAWVSNAENKRKNDNNFAEASPSSRGRFFVMTAPILNHSEERCVPMPLMVNNKLPGCTLRFGKTEADEVSFTCHIDTCAAMSTGNLLLHQWIMTKYPSIIVECTQYDDSTPFEQIRLYVALKGLDGCNNMKNKLMAVVRYWTPYLDKDENHQVI